MFSLGRGGCMREYARGCVHVCVCVCALQILRVLIFYGLYT